MHRFKMVVLTCFCCYFTSKNSGTVYTSSENCKIIAFSCSSYGTEIQTSAMRIAKYCYIAFGRFPHSTVEKYEYADWFNLLKCRESKEKVEKRTNKKHSNHKCPSVRIHSKQLSSDSPPPQSVEFICITYRQGGRAHNCSKMPQNPFQIG
jgi:hypothetical protein